MEKFSRGWELIEASHSILIGTHKNPDIDTIASGLAFYLLCKELKKKVTLVNVDIRTYKNHFNFLPCHQKIVDQIPSEIDLIITVDTAASHLLRFDLMSFNSPIINIDHHVSNEKYGTLNIVNEKYGSTGELVYQFLKSRLATLSGDIASCLYAAIVSDTRFFTTERVTQETFSCVNELVSYGVKTRQIAMAMNERTSLSTLRLTQKTLEKFSLIANARLAYVILDEDDFLFSGAQRYESDGCADLLLSLATVEVACVARVEKDGTWKISLRSKTCVNVALIAKFFGGGGHEKSAGLLLKNDYQTHFNKLIDTLTMILKGDNE